VCLWCFWCRLCGWGKEIAKECVWNRAATVEVVVVAPVTDARAEFETGWMPPIRLRQRSRSRDGGRDDV
jgi:hypothetical protein